MGLWEYGITDWRCEGRSWKQAVWGHNCFLAACEFHFYPGWIEQHAADLVIYLSLFLRNCKGYSQHSSANVRNPGSDGQVQPVPS